MNDNNMYTASLAINMMKNASDYAVSDNIKENLVSKNITENGVYAPSGDKVDGYSSVNVNVSNSYSSTDEGKVVSDGALVAQTAYPTEITENNTYDTTNYNSITVNVSSGGGSATKKDVNFYDYDGSIVYSYTATDFANLSELPANPTHSELTAQGWNWTLANAKSYVASYGKLDIGQMYASNTTDGKTILHIILGEGRLKPYLGLTGNSSGTAVSIDWGDGSASENVTLNTSTVYTPHEYVSDGEYNIAISVTSGSISFNSTSNSTNIFRKSPSQDTNNDKVYANILTKVEIGTGVTSIGDYAFNGCYSLTSVTLSSSVTTISKDAFYYCYNLHSITIPNTVTSIGSSVFDDCTALVSITIPNTITSLPLGFFNKCCALDSVSLPHNISTIGMGAFTYCYSLSSVAIPDSVTYMDTYAFSGCSSLTSITIPSTVTSIANHVFDGDYGLGFIKFSSTNPPTVSSAGTWTGIPTDCIIYVPSGSLSTYTSAQYYPNSSNYQYVEY